MIMSQQKSYKLFPHTSDLGIEVVGRSLKELFNNAGLALLDLVVDPATVAAHETVELSVRGDDRELLFREWLGELLYQVFVKEFVFKTIQITRLDNYSLQARAIGEKIDYRRHQLKRELKSITYHQLKVSEIDDSWLGRFVVDI